MKIKLEQLKQRINALDQGDNGQQKFQQKQNFKKTERDELVEGVITELVEHINKENMETVVISIGSGNAPKQQNPDFLKYLGKATIVNIDEYFRDENCTTKENVNIEYIPSIISSKDTPKAYKQLREAISEWTHSGKKVIFMDHTFPGGHNYFHDIIEQNLDRLGSTFCYIGSYHQNQPVAVYSEAFLDINKGNKREKNALKNKLWVSGKIFTDDELQKSLQAHDFSYGSFYCDLNLVDPGNLFPKNNNLKSEDLFANTPKKEKKENIRNNEEAEKTIQEAVKKIKEFQYDDFDLHKQNTKQQALDYKKLVKEKFQVFMNSKEMIAAYSLGDSTHKEDIRRAYQEKIKEIDKVCEKHIGNIGYVNSVSALIDKHDSNRRPSSKEDEFARKLQEEVINAGIIKK